jgi:MFS family permease
MLRAVLNLPPALYLAILGNKAVFYFFNTFSLFSASVYNEKFGLSGSQASLATGLTPLLAGILAPFMGRAMDKFGHRSKFFLVGTGLASIGYLLLGISESSAAVWIGSVLFAINNSFGAHVIVMLPMIVGSSRAGLAYGVYGILGNIFDASTSFLSGVILDSGDNGAEMYVWFTFAMTFMGVLAWIGVYVLESRISFIETPLDQIIETRIEYFHFATLCGVAMENDTESPGLENKDSASGDVDEVPEEIHA